MAKGILVEADEWRNEKMPRREKIDENHKYFPKWENNLKIGRGCAMGKSEPGGYPPGSGAS